MLLVIIVFIIFFIILICLCYRFFSFSFPPPVRTTVRILFPRDANTITDWETKFRKLFSRQYPSASGRDSLPWQRGRDFERNDSREFQLLKPVSSLAHWSKSRVRKNQFRRRKFEYFSRVIKLLVIPSLFVRHFLSLPLSLSSFLSFLFERPCFKKGPVRPVMPDYCP